MSRAWSLGTIFVVFISGGIASAHATEKPLWELGIGVAPGSFSSYRGSDDREFYVLPFPYFVYRGEYLRADRKGIRGLLFDSERLTLAVSLNGSTPAESDDSSARRGMPDLDPTFEIGPALKIVLSRGQDDSEIYLNLPFRAVFATDLSDFEQIGYLAHPSINFSTPRLFKNWNFGIRVGPQFATGDYHDYYYTVAQRFVTPSRPAFDASGGYSGTAAIFSTSKRFKRFWVGGFLRYDNLSGASFEDSPLIETEHAVSVGMAVAWIFAQSKKRVSGRVH